MTFAPVQSKAGSGTSSPVTVTLSSPTGAGNCLVVKVSLSNSSPPTVSSVKLGGAAGNFASAKAASVGPVGVAIWIDEDCAGGQTAVAVAFSGGTGLSPEVAVWVEEWSGVKSSGAVDVSNDGTGSGGTTFSSNSSGTLSQANELVIAAVAAFGPSMTITGPATGGWTNLAQESAGTSVGLMAGYQVVSATTALTYSGTLSTSSSDYAAVIVTLEGGTPVSSSDTGSGAESSSIAVSDTDAGTGADAGTVAATVSSAETGSGSDAARVGVASGDTGSGAEAASPPPATLTAPDTGAGAEGAPSIAFTAAGDTGSAADVATAVLGASGSDTGTAAESSSISVQIGSGDTGSGAEASTIAATLPATADTGSGADVARVGVTSGDTGSGEEHAVQAPFIAPPAVLWRAPDYLSKTGGTMR
jgi:hypothetical protein